MNMSVFKQWKLMQTIVPKLTHKDIPILYHKDGLIGIYKPYGLPVHGGPRVKNSITQLFPEWEKDLCLPKNSLALVNRLDKNVSGAMLLSYDSDMARKVSELYQNRLVKKKYLAIVVGKVKLSTGLMHSDIQMVGSSRLKSYKQKVSIVDESVSAARTLYKVLDSNKGMSSLLSYEMSTGYKHQIRTHTSQILNCPILGDHKYHDGPHGPQVLPLRMMQQLGMEGVRSRSGGRTKGMIRPWQRGLVPLHLFAQRILLPGLDNGEDVKIWAPLPDYFAKSMENLNLIFQREEYEEQMMVKLIKKQKKTGIRKETIYDSKNVTHHVSTSETSL